MEKIKKNFGFGFMRLPMKDGEIDTEETKRMVDAFLDAGFNYFDTAHGYHKEKSEIALRECLTSRYPRESYVLADKLTENYFKDRGRHSSRIGRAARRLRRGVFRFLSDALAVHAQLSALQGVPRV